MKKLLWTGIFIFYVVSFVYAQSYPSIDFFGNVQLNGASAKDGLLVTARISNQDVESGTTRSGRYGDNLDFDVPNDNNNEGKTIIFFIQGFDTQESFIFSYDSPPYELDLDLSGDLFCGDNLCGSSESCTSCSTDCGSCPSTSSGSSGGGSGGGGGGGGSSGGGGGGGGGGFTYVCNQDWDCTEWTACSNNLQTRTCEFVKVAQHSQSTPCATQDNQPATSQSCQLETCKSDWVCSDWLPCISASQKRVCVDSNRCSPETSRPEEERQCDLTESAAEETTNTQTSQGGVLSSIKSFFSSITGSAVASPESKKNTIAVIIAAVFVMVAGAGFIYRNRIFNMFKK